jgi:ABC-type dipeptide/oligopeptide/nickel transport system permease component
MPTTFPASVAMLMPLGVGFVLMQLSNEMNKKLSLDMSFYVNSFKYWKKFLAIGFSSSFSCHEVGSLVDMFWSHTPRSLFNGLPWFFLHVSP